MAEQIWPEHSLEVPRRLKRRHSAPFLTLTPEPLDGPGRSWKGSRFWALDNESHEGSENEDIKQNGVVSDDGLINSEKKLLSDAVRVGFSADEVIRAETVNRKFSFSKI